MTNVATATASSSNWSRSKKSSSKMERTGSSSATAQPMASTARVLRCCIPRIVRLTTADGFDENGANLVRVHVRGRATVFEVALPGVDGGHGDAHRGAAVEVANPEGVDGRGLVQAGQPLLVVRAVDGDVIVVALFELLHGLADDVEPAVVAHRLGGEVGVRPGAVPIAAHRLRVERGAHAEVFADPVEQPAGHPQLVGHVRGANRADLE